MIDLKVLEAYKYLWLVEVRGTVFVHSRVRCYTKYCCI